MNESLDYVVVMGAKMVKVDDKWIFPTYIGDGENRRVVGGKFRGVAAFYLDKEGLTERFLVTGGLQHDGLIYYSRAQVMADYISGIGVLKAKLVVLTSAERNTFSNCIAAKLHVDKNKRNLIHGRIGLLTNNFHLERCLRMFDIAGPNIPNLEIVGLDAEEVLIRNSKFYELVIETISNSDAMRATILEEQEGLRALEAGSYVPRNVN